MACEKENRIYWFILNMFSAAEIQGKLIASSSPECLWENERKKNLHLLSLHQCGELKFDCEHEGYRGGHAEMVNIYTF